MLFYNEAAPPENYTLSLHDALPISCRSVRNPPEPFPVQRVTVAAIALPSRSEEHTSELQSHVNLVCRLLLEKKKPEQHSSRLLLQRFRSAQQPYRARLLPTPMRHEP